MESLETLLTQIITFFPKSLSKVRQLLLSGINISFLLVHIQSTSENLYVHQQAVLKLLNRLPHKSILLSNITYWLGGKKPIIREQDEMWRVGQGRTN